MDEEHQLKRFLQHTKDSKHAAEVMPAVGKLFESVASSAAWQVAVVSPGFLGLLWNASTLAERSRLPHVAFSMLFIGAEVAFLIAIVGSVIVHAKTTEMALHVVTLTTSLQSLSKAFEEAGLTEELQGDKMKTLFDQLKDVDRQCSLGTNGRLDGEACEEGRCEEHLARSAEDVHRLQHWPPFVLEPFPEAANLEQAKFHNCQQACPKDNVKKCGAKNVVVVHCYVSRTVLNIFQLPDISDAYVGT